MKEFNQSESGDWAAHHDERHHAAQQSDTGRHHKRRGFSLLRKSQKIWLIGLITTIILGITVSTSLYFYQQANRSLISSTQYQAVFLANGQVYFGKLHRSIGGYLTMSDIYYLQVQSAQPAGAAVSKDASPVSTDASDTQLVKLGQELHAPEDSMVINKDQVLFWEDIKDSGKVAQAINDYKKGKTDK